MTWQDWPATATLGAADVAAAAGVATWKQGKRAEARATELHDVDWLAEVVDQDVTLAHAGVHQAHDVTMVVKWYETIVREHRDLMAQGDEITVQIIRAQ